MKYDLLIKDGNVYPLNRILDMGIKDGKIVDLKQGLSPDEAETVIDAKNCTISPAFVDAHMHIDKALTADEDDTTDLLQACIRADHKTHESYMGWDRQAIVDDIVERSSEIIKMCIANGTTAIKTHVLITPDIGFAALDAMDILKEKYKDYITIKTVVPAYDDFLDEWKEYARKGSIDCVGGYPNMEYNEATGNLDYTLAFKKEVDKAFELAKKYDLPVDLHCDESDSDNLSCFLYMIDQTYANQMQGRVTCSHVTGLGSKDIDEAYAADAIARAAKTCVNITTMTSCNMYLMDIGRRGPTRVRQLLDCGINVSIASDNIRDPFRPFGNADLLEEGLLTAQLHKFGTKNGLNKIAQMITIFPAANLNLPDYGILPGCNADVVVLDAPDMNEAILSQVKKSYVIKLGKVVAKDGNLV